MRFVWVLLASCTLLIAGCSVSTIASHPSPPTPNPEPANTKPFSGKVMGGQQPIVGAQIYLLAVSTSGYGNESTSLLLSTGPDNTSGGVNGWYYATTNSSGQFTIGVSDFACTAGEQVYLYSLGGNPQVAGTNNDAGLMAVLGQCGAGSTFTGLPALVQMNEVTTVAAAWALAGYATDATHISGPNTTAAATGMANAALNAANLASLSTGMALTTTPGGNGTVPQAKINTLANILASCINTASAGCSTLFLYAKNAGGTEPTDTATAAINIAHNPGANVTLLYPLATASAVFQPTLSSPPDDWMIGVNYDGGGLCTVCTPSSAPPSTPGALALDSSGNVWVTNYFSEVTELSPTGNALSPAAGFTGGYESYGLTVNSDNSVWVTEEQSSSVNNGDGTIIVLNSSGGVISGADGYSTGGIYFPQAIAADTNGDVWVANYGDGSATLFSWSGSSATAISSSNGFAYGQDCVYTNPPSANENVSCLAGPVAVAIDAKHNAWFPNEGGPDPGTVTSISPDGTAVNLFTSGGSAPDGVATDALGPGAGHVWIANYYSNSVSEIEIPSTGSPIVVSTGYTGGGLTAPNGVAVDGGGNVWVTNFHGDSLTELEGASGNSPGTAISPSSGFGTDGSLVSPFGVAVDESGNLWVSNQGGNTVTEFVGGAVPVKTPLLGPPSLP